MKYTCNERATKQQAKRPSVHVGCGHFGRWFRCLLGQRPLWVFFVALASPAAKKISQRGSFLLFKQFPGHFGKKEGLATPILSVRRSGFGCILSLRACLAIGNGRAEEDFEIAARSERGAYMKYICNERATERKAKRPPDLRGCVGFGPGILLFSAFGLARGAR
jgi:hypothetical protein